MKVVYISNYTFLLCFYPEVVNAGYGSEILYRNRKNLFVLREEHALLIKKSGC